MRTVTFIAMDKVYSFERPKDNLFDNKVLMRAYSYFLKKLEKVT